VLLNCYGRRPDQAWPPHGSESILPGKRSLIVGEGNIESPPMAVGVTNQFNQFDKQLNNANAGSRSRRGSS
jgi:hypothetical protein